MKLIEVDVDYVDDECDVDEVDNFNLAAVLWGKKIAGACGRVTNSKTSLNFSSFSPFLSKHWTFVQESGISTIRLAILGLWRLARKSHPPKSIPSRQSSVPSWVNG